MGDCAFWGFGMFMHMYMHTSMENLQKKWKKLIIFENDFFLIFKKLEKSATSVQLRNYFYFFRRTNIRGMKNKISNTFSFIFGVFSVRSTFGPP